MSGILDNGTTVKEKADQIFWNKGGPVSLSHFLAFQGFLAFSFTGSPGVSRPRSISQGRAGGGDSPGEAGGVCHHSCVSVRTKRFHSVIFFIFTRGL